MQKPSQMIDADRVAAGAPKSEKNESSCPEITPEMKIAGARVLLEHYPEATGPLCFEGEVAVELFLAMWRASR
jgi:hypothetical protein